MEDTALDTPPDRMVGSPARKSVMKRPRWVAGGQPLETRERPSDAPAAARLFGEGARMRFPHVTTALFATAVVALVPALAHASEASLVLPDLASVRFLGVDGWSLLFWMGLV